MFCVMRRESNSCDLRFVFEKKCPPSHPHRLSVLSLVHKCFAFYVLCYESLFVRFSFYSWFFLRSQRLTQNITHKTLNVQPSPRFRPRKQYSRFVLFVFFFVHLKIRAIRAIRGSKYKISDLKFLCFQRVRFLSTACRPHVSACENNIRVNLCYSWFFLSTSKSVPSALSVVLFCSPRPTNVKRITQNIFSSCSFFAIRFPGFLFLCHEPFRTFSHSGRKPLLAFVRT
jgi:hypothetical protein